MRKVLTLVCCLLVFHTGYAGEKRISLNFQDTPVHVLLQTIADFSGKNISISSDIEQSVSINLEQVTWQEALEVILLNANLQQRLAGESIIVEPVVEQVVIPTPAMDKQPEVVAPKPPAPLHKQYMILSYAAVSEVSQMVEKLLSARGSLDIDKRTNTLILQDTLESINKITELIKQIDVPLQQVIITARIVIVNNNFLRELGTRFGIFHSDGKWSTGGTLAGVNAVRNDNSKLADINSRSNINMPVSTATSSLAFSFAKLPLNTMLELELSAMQQEGEGKLISSPKVITANRHEAMIQQGMEIPYQAETASGATNVEFKEAVMELRVTPYVAADKNITMDLNIKKDSVNTSVKLANGEPSIATREISTRITVADGETVVLGGIMEEVSGLNESSVPFLSDLPLIGRLFRIRADSSTQAQMLIFVTPKVL